MRRTAHWKRSRPENRSVYHQGLRDRLAALIRQYRRQMKYIDRVSKHQAFETRQFCVVTAERLREFEKRS